MALAEIKPMRGCNLYDRDGNLVGMWYGNRGMFFDCYVVRGRERHAIENAIEKRHPDKFNVCRRCSVCSGGWHEDVYDEPYRYCPRCGARLVRDDGKEG
jgi:hypothetical protein